MLQALLTVKVLLSPQRSLIAAFVVFCMMLSIASKPVLASSPVFGEQKAAAHIKVGLVSEQGYLVAGETAQLALRLLPDEGWHTYWRNPGDTGLPTRVIWQLPEQFRAGEFRVASA